MYLYDEFDKAVVAERVAEFRDQVERRLSGALTEDEFKPLRLMNGVYLQLHAYMLRVAIPYGSLSSDQMRTLAHVARRYDRGYGHFTTRQNIQFNWIKLDDMPEVLEALAQTHLHAMQTSGNCIRNVTSDQWAGVAPDEVEDPRIYAEILRQHSTMHPEFSFLPRKFKIAVTAADHDRAAIRVHDIGLRLHRNDSGETGFEVVVGGGLGRTPFIGKTIKPFLPKRDLLSYIEAVLRVYNLYGRRDNIYKARIKILVHELGAEKFAAAVDEEWRAIRDSALALDDAIIADIASRFRLSRLRKPRPMNAIALKAERAADRGFDTLVRQFGRRAQSAGLCDRDRVAEADRRAARRRHGRPDGHDRRSGRSLFVREKSGSDMSRIWCCRMCVSATCRRCSARSMPSDWRRPMSAWSPTLSRAPAWIIAASPIRARSRWRRN